MNSFHALDRSVTKGKTGICASVFASVFLSFFGSSVSFSELEEDDVDGLDEIGVGNGDEGIDVIGKVDGVDGVDIVEGVPGDGDGVLESGTGVDVLVTGDVVVRFGRVVACDGGGGVGGVDETVDGAVIGVVVVGGGGDGVDVGAGVDVGVVDVDVVDAAGVGAGNIVELDGLDGVDGVGGADGFDRVGGVDGVDEVGGVEGVDGSGANVGVGVLFGESRGMVALLCGSSELCSLGDE